MPPEFLFSTSFKHVYKIVCLCWEEGKGAFKGSFFAALS